MKSLIHTIPLLALSSFTCCYGFITPGHIIRSPIVVPTINALFSTSIDDANVIENTSINSQPTQRRIAKTEKFARLPVWPVWQGVFIFFASKILGEEFAANLEDSIGGRVCPNFFSSSDVIPNSYNGGTSPFVLLVHHRHAFMNWDPVRYIQATFFPEGFPSHPHRGFITVTYILKGGFYHRDSLGIKQEYGAEEKHQGRHVQWLTAGAGIQHEEMWDTEPDKKDKGKLLTTSSQELYQIWLNLPAANKMDTPDAKVLQAYDIKEKNARQQIPENSTPVITADGTITTVVAGEHDGIRAPVECPTNAAIIRIQFTQKDTTTWKHILPSSHETAILYVKQGSIQIDGQRIPPHHTVYLSPDGEELTVQALEGEADVLLLSGEPIREPIASQGSMVMNTQGEIQKAYMDYQRGFMGIPWDHRLTDDEWREHVKQNPSQY